ncbi:MAG: Fur family transcriptional regulator [Actinomycetota bacterium]|nr:Fur family transcriptional regulator [Actinomycetota bacterium]
MRAPAELVELFRENGKKVTPQRERIFHILHGNSGHPSAEAVFARLSAEMPTVSLKTVYQTLAELVEMGELQALDLGMGATRFDPNDRAHHHLLCTRCRRIEDVALELPDFQELLSHGAGFAVESVELTVRGICSRCQEEEAGHTPAESRSDQRQANHHARSRGGTDA